MAPMQRALRLITRAVMGLCCISTEFKYEYIILYHHHQIGELIVDKHKAINKVGHGKFKLFVKIHALYL